MSLNRSSYKWAITIDDINKFTSSERKSNWIISKSREELSDVLISWDVNLDKQKNAVRTIQRLKADITKRILSSFNVVDSWMVKESEEIYIEALESLGQVKWLDKSVVWKKMKAEIERMFKSYSSLDENRNYLGLFETNLNKNKKVDEESIEWSKSKSIFFDKNEFEKHTDKSKPFQMKCFYEQDNSWKTNYFSLNDLINDITTFGTEVWYPKLTSEIPEEYKKYFPSLWRRIRFAVAKSLIIKYRDYQETIMYWFDDYEKQWKYSEKQEWVSVEHIVEWHFRTYANAYPWYKIFVEKASIWEDQQWKIDLFIRLEDQKTWVNVKKLLQLTVNPDPEVLAKKRRVIERIKRWSQMDIQLLNPQIDRLSNSLQIWRKFGRPIWWVWKIMSEHDDYVLKNEFDKIVEDLKWKISRKK